MPSARTYRLYGLRLSSEWSLPLPQIDPTRPDLELVHAHAPSFASYRGALGEIDAFGSVRLGDELYLRWEGLAEFVIVRGGRQVRGRPLAPGWAEAFRAYLLTQVISFAMIEAGREHLHATAVEVEGRGVAFTAQPGTGKSTLAAAFVAAGDRLLTDDILAIGRRRGSRFVEPGYPRMRLSPEATRRVLPELVGRAAPHPVLDKLVVPLGRERWASESVPLVRVYAVSSGGRSVRARAVDGAEAFRVLAENTYNSAVTGRERLRRHLAFTADLAREVPVVRLSVPRGFERLQEVRERILADLSR